MRKLIILTFMTLDGVTQAPGGKEEDTENGFPYGGWEMNFSDSSVSMSHYLADAGAILLGRKTYDIFAPYWPTIGKDIPWYGPFMNQTPKYVASTTLKKTEWQNSTLLKGNLKEAITQLKAEPGKDIYVMGSSNLSQTLMDENLVDEYILMVYPIVLGQGKQLFQKARHKQDLELVSSKTSPAGIIVLNYKVKKK